MTIFSLLVKKMICKEMEESHIAVFSSWADFQVYGGAKVSAATTTIKGCSDCKASPNNPSNSICS